MELSFTHRFSRPVDDVLAMYADPAFGEARGKATGATQVSVEVAGEPSGPFDVVITRVVPTDGVRPDFRGFLGPTITVRYAEAWEAPEEPARDGTFAVEIVGAPARAAGAVRLEPQDGGSLMSIHGTVTSNAFLVAAAVSQAVGEALTEALEREFEAADAWLGA